jgi:hypothetical protein
LEFIDGFDHYTNAAMVTRKWDTTSVLVAVGTAGRFAGGAANMGSSSQHLDLTALASVATRTIGFAFQLTGASTGNTLVQFLDSGTEQLSVRTTTGLALLISRNGTTLATSTPTLSTGIWYYLEFKATIHPTAGAYELRITAGGAMTAWLSGSSANTRNTANSTMNGVKLPGNQNWLVDDLYILNSSGSVNNDFLGESRILTSLPNADDTAATGTNLLWTPDSGTPHFSRVNEATPNDDTSYVSSATAGQIDTYKFATVSPTGAVAGLQTVLTARKDDVGSRTICAEYRSSGGTNYDGATSFSPGSSYLMFRQLYETDPATSAAWIASGINNGEFGVKCIA